MKKITILLSTILLLGIATSCDKQETENKPEQPNNVPQTTLLVYMAGDNNLSNMVSNNIKSMNTCISDSGNYQNLVVFVDKKNELPCMIQIKPTGIDTLMVYEELNSADASTLSKTIEYVKDNFKTNSYGLVLWGHGMGWLPTSQQHFVASNMGFAPMRSTRSYAMESRPDETPAYTCMEIEDMANAIPDGMFEYIAFDACYMGNVEIMYALRNKTHYIVSCCSEEVSYGYPYLTVTADLLNGNLAKVCKHFIEYYNSFTGWQQMGDLSLVKTDGLDSLASCFKKIVAEHKDVISDMDLSNVQCFDIFNKHVFFDLEDFVIKLGTKTEYMNEFRLQLEKCVLYKVCTPYIFPGEFEQVEIKSYSGMSVYIPIQDYESSGLNDDYRKTEWYKNTYSE